MTLMPILANMQLKSVRLHPVFDLRHDGAAKRPVLGCKTARFGTQNGSFQEPKRQVLQHVGGQVLNRNGRCWRV